MGRALPWSFAGVLAVFATGCTFEAGTYNPIPDAGANAYQCSCECRNEAVSREVFVATGDDDAEELLSTGAVNLTSTDLEMVQAGGGAQLTGLRFVNLGIPQGATVVSAHLQFYTDEVSTAPTTLIIEAEAADNAAPFAATTGNLSTRPRTGAQVGWMPAPWNTLNEGGPDQRTPNLAPVLQEVVNRAGYTPDSAVAFLIGGTGLRIAASFNRGAMLTPRLIVTFQEPGVEVALNACAPDELNPTTGGTGLTPENMAMDCEGRVEATVRGLAGACGYPAVCECAVVAMSEPTFSDKCVGTCAGEEVAGDCSNFDPVAGEVTATHAGMDTPVCVTSSPLSAAMFGRLSECEVTGTATVTAEDESKSTSASGLIAFTGGPCAEGTSCLVGAQYRMALAPITYESLFSSATFEDLMGTGQSLAGAEAVLSNAGVGVFEPGAVANAAHGRRGSEAMGLRGSNGSQISVSLLGGSERSCGLSGNLVSAVDPELKRCEPFGPSASAICSGDGDCADHEDCSDEVCNCLPLPSSNVTLALEVSGTLFNQPPVASAGPDQVVECNLPGAARFDLVGAVSDPDSNLAQIAWRSGARNGPLVGVGRVSTVEQAAGSAVSYFLRVLDARAQSDEDRAEVQVVDTTAPVISCNAPATISPPDPVLSFTATAEDVCDANVTPQITTARCYRINGAGKVIDLTHACGLQVAGDTITVRRTLGVGDNIEWTAVAVDGFGNASSVTCSVAVVRP